MPGDIGQALVAYLRRGRPETNHRRLFVRLDAPRSGLSSGAVTARVHTAGRRVGFTVTGAHQLRHTVAVGLLRAGAPMSEISELLRRRRPATAAIYAKVDRRSLGSLARLAGGCVMSAMRQAAEDHLALRRAMGFKLNKPGRLVLQFAEHLDRLGIGLLTIDTAQAWARQPTQPTKRSSVCSP